MEIKIRKYARKYIPQSRQRVAGFKRRKKHLQIKRSGSEEIFPIFCSKQRKALLCQKMETPNSLPPLKNQQCKIVYLPAPKRSGCGMKIDREDLVGLHATFYQPHRHRKTGRERNGTKTDQEPKNKCQMTYHSPCINAPRRKVCLLQQLPPQYPTTSPQKTQ